MRCVKCNAELPDGTKFCKFCGAQQPERQMTPPVYGTQPQNLHCPNCGKEIPAGSRFCKHCGATINTATPPPARPATPPPARPVTPPPAGPATPPPTRPVTPPPTGPATPPPTRPVTPPPAGPVTPPSPGTGSYGPGPSGSDPYGPGVSAPPEKKKTGLIIGCIIAGLVLLVAIGALVWFVFGPGKKEEPARNDTELQDDRDNEDTDEPDQDDEADGNGETAGTEEPAEAPAPVEPAVPEKLTGEEAYLAKQATGIAGTVDYGVVSYEPQSGGSDMAPEVSDRMMALMEDGAFDSAPVVTGSLYSMTEDRDLEVKVYYHPETYDIERITTLQAEEDHYRMYEMYFEEGKLAMVNDVVTVDNMDSYLVGPDYDPTEIKYGLAKAYTLYYTQDALMGLSILRESGESEMYLRLGLENMDDGVQSLYLAREAEYLNRAYITYDAVTN